MSNTPLTVDLPHKLGAEEARRRIAGGIGRFGDFIPGQAEVRSAWTGDRLGLQVLAMGQEVNAGIDVHDTFVRVELLLPLPRPASTLVLLELPVDVDVAPLTEGELATDDWPLLLPTALAPIEQFTWRAMLVV